MSMVSYYGRGLSLFMESPIIVLAVLFAVTNAVASQEIYVLVKMGINVDIQAITMILVSIFTGTAVIGIIPKILLKEKTTLKTIWEIKKKCIFKIAQLLLLLIIIYFLVYLSVVGIESLMLLEANTPHYPRVGLFIFAMLFVLGLICSLFVFTYPEIVIGENSGIGTIKEGIQLVTNNKSKAILLGFPLMFSLISIITLPDLLIS